MPKKEPANIDVLMSLIPHDPTVESMWTEGNSIVIRSYHLFPEHFIAQANGVARDHGCMIHTWENANGEQLIRISLPESTSRKEDEDIKNPEQEFIALALLGDKINLVSLTPDGTYKFIDEAQNLHSIVYVISSEILALHAAVEELESLVNNPKTKEQDLQEFFEHNPEFILNDEYRKAHPHIVLSKDDGECLIPDFVLEPLDQNSLSDLLDLKLPSAQIFVLKKSRMRFSAAVLEACAQLREYRHYFYEKKNQEAVYEKYGLRAYEPRMFVIIGRRGNINPIDVRKMEADMPKDVYLRTYDDVIARMKARIDRMGRGIKVGDKYKA
jgi:hypothetical protein